MLKQGAIKRLAIALLISAALALLFSTKLVVSIANNISDALYQTPGAPSDEIILIGMDEDAIEAYGSTPWPRDIIAASIEYLNEDPQRRPAVIGIDTLFTGESDSLENDERLADAAAEYGNVVTATSATFESTIVTQSDGTFYIDDYHISLYEEPYSELLKVTTQGHVNAMADTDGILRHAVWQIDVPDGRQIPSFHGAIYELYMQHIGQSTYSTPHTDPRHRWYLPFGSAPFAYDDGFSVTQLVNKELDPDIFAGKIVLIGPYASGMSDEYQTSIDHAVKMYGVEYQANAIAALLSGETKKEILLMPQLIFAFFVCFFCVLWFNKKSMVASLIMWLSISIGFVLLCLLAWQMGFVLQAMYVPVTATICFILSVAENYAVAAFEKRKISNTFKRYVAPEIVAELLKGEPEALSLGGKTENIAVLMVDVRGFTSMAENLEPEEVVEIINMYLTMTSKCIFKNGGTLDKYIGDSTMAFWGAPLKQDDIVFKAVNAALDMISEAEKLGKEIFEKHGQYLQFGIGINYGPAVVGNVGSNVRMDYTAIGNTVNVAARLENNAPPGCIYASKAVRDEVLGRIEFMPIGKTIKLKGMHKTLEIFKIEGLLKPPIRKE